MADLFLTHRGVVYPWQCDQMGHMNVMWYVGKFDEATWQMFAQMGLTPPISMPTMAVWLPSARRSPIAASCALARSFPFGPASSKCVSVSSASIMKCVTTRMAKSPFAPTSSRSRRHGLG